MINVAENDPDAELLNAVGRAVNGTDSGETVATIAHPDAASPPGWWSTANAMTMSSVVLVFGLVVLGLAAWLVRGGHAVNGVLRVFGTVLVIVMVTFLVVAGYDDKQIAAPLGLLGTIVGYLLGRDSGRAGDPEPTPPTRAPSPRTDV